MRFNFEYDLSKALIAAEQLKECAKELKNRIVGIYSTENEINFDKDTPR